MNKVRMEMEHAELKSRLAELVDFINSKEYYNQSDSEKMLVSTQRSGMETYINALSIRLWGNGSENTVSPSSIWPLLISSMFMPFGSNNTNTFPSATEEKVEKVEKAETEK